MTERTIGPTPERLRMAGDAVEVFTPDENVNYKAIQLLDRHVLEFLRRRQTINNDLYSAGSQYYKDWFYGKMGAGGVVDPGRIKVDGGKVDHVSERQLFALNRWRKAVQGVGLIHSTVLSDLLLEEEPLHVWGERRRGHKNRERARESAITALVLALEQLDLHYHGPRNIRTRSSHADGYRPVIVDDVSA